MRRNHTQLLGTLTCIGALTSAGANAGQVTPLSNLSDGSFERQLELPDHQRLESDSPLAQAAANTYHKLPFDPAERMRFVVTYLGVSGGAAVVIIQPPVNFGESWAHRMTGEVKSAR